MNFPFRLGVRPKAVEFIWNGKANDVEDESAENPYGYKVCYREKHGKEFVRKFITSTYKEAVKVKKTYLLAPQIAEMQALDRPTWNIYPITKKEVRAGIWKEAPF